MTTQIISNALPANQRSDFEQSLMQFPRRCVRLHANRDKSDLPFEASRTDWFDRGFLLANSEIRPSQFLQYATGDYYIQDAGSLLAVALADVQPHERVCDLCAAPGGKASAMLEQLGNGPQSGGFLVANEPIGSRIEILRHQLNRTGNPRFAVTNADPQRLAERFPNAFDVVLVDAPCSGQALTIKNKRSDDAFSPKQIEHSAARQQRILRAALSLLRVGGRLVYSTCTFADLENESQIDWLLDTFPESLAAMPDQNLASWLSPLQPSSYRLWPHRDRCAGAFAARLLKVSETEPKSFSDAKTGSGNRAWLAKRRTDANREKIAEPLDVENFGQLSSTLLHRSEQAIAMVSDDVSLAAWLEAEKLSVNELPIAWELKQQRAIPTQLLAHLDRRYFQPASTVELTDEEARRVIGGAALAIDQRTAVSSGYTLACWHGRGIGWLKHAGNRWNNQLPAIARLR